jgi:hypothetical protein
MKKVLICLVFIANAVITNSQPSAEISFSKNPLVSNYEFSYNEVMFNTDTMYRKLMLDSIFQADFWDTVPQPMFWKKIINLSGDSAILNVSHNRQILEIVSIKRYSKMGDERRSIYRDSLRRAYNLPDSAKIFFSTGKQFFYQFYKAIPNIDASIPIFIENGADPWYAQAILLIESPNRLQKSNVGAYGPFQLMKSVGLKYGLKINKKVDERKYLDRSAYAAAQFVKRICVPSVRTMLDTMNITYNESDLWFRLLTMHVYHAGAGNVRKALAVIKPTEGGLPLIYKMWQTEAGGFRNASQNYTQVLLAALMQLETIVQRESKEVRRKVPGQTTYDVIKY